jgi:hypothetical protein
MLASNFKQGARRIMETNPVTELQQFDFWLGEWDVYSEDKLIAYSRIEKVTNGHIILENYEQSDGYSGKSISYYDPYIKKWRQNWVDSLGTVGDFNGDCKDSVMRYEGESHLVDGRKILRLMIVSRLNENEVRQYSERSDDEGKSWKLAYDFIYRKKLDK